MMDNMEIFMDVYSGLPRGGPGSNASSRRAWAMLPAVPPAPRILDVGCGPGMQTVELARLSGGTVTALDFHQPFLDKLAASAAAAGVADRVRTVHGSMDALPFAPGEFDIIWGEGSLYIMDFAKALGYLKGFLKPGGYLAATEATWLRNDVPERPRKFWEACYPAITDVAGNLGLFAAAGYGMVGHFALPGADWWDNYYRPLEQRLPQMRAKYAGNPAGLAIVAEAQAEIDLHREYGEYYGYVFYIARK